MKNSPALPRLKPVSGVCLNDRVNIHRTYRNHEHLLISTGQLVHITVIFESTSFPYFNPIVLTG